MQENYFDLKNVLFCHYKLFILIIFIFILMIYFIYIYTNETSSGNNFQNLKFQMTKENFVNQNIL